MGQATDEARHQVELTRVALAADIDKLEKRIRAELDWKARLRRDGPQIVAIAGAVVVVAVGAFALRRAVGKKKEGDPASPPPVTLDELAREVRALRDELHGKRKDGTSPSEPLWQKIAIRGATAGAAAGASMLARRYARRQEDAAEHAASHSS